MLPGGFQHYTEITGYDLAGALLRAMIDKGINPHPDVWLLIPTNVLERTLGAVAWSAFRSMDNTTHEQLCELGRLVSSGSIAAS